MGLLWNALGIEPYYRVAVKACPAKSGNAKYKSHLCKSGLQEYRFKLTFV